MAANNPFLQVSNLKVFYGGICALDEVSLHIDQGEIVSVIGANGAGKSTLMRTVAAVKTYTSGTITFKGQPLQTDPSRVVSDGITLVPEGRRIFAPLTVRENLMVGARTRKDMHEIQQTMEEVFVLFPRLKERITQRGGTLSGGEQQMLATGRGMMLKPKILLMDEPSMGLAPVLVDAIFDVIRTMNNEGTTILLVEQNALMALKVASRAYVLETGRIVLSGSAQEVAQNPQVRRAYLGG